MAAIDELTRRELVVLGLMAEGYSNAGIADELVVSLRTVESHIGMIFMKVGLAHERGCHRRVRAVLWYQERWQGVARAA
jgi:DNA-binding NarL/FixJ family response regulator